MLAKSSSCNLISRSCGNVWFGGSIYLNAVALSVDAHSHTGPLPSNTPHGLNLLCIVLRTQLSQFSVWPRPVFLPWIRTSMPIHRT